MYLMMDYILHHYLLFRHAFLIIQFSMRINDRIYTVNQYLKSWCEINHIPCPNICRNYINHLPYSRSTNACGVSHGE